MTNQYALFAEDRLSLTDQWTLIGGIRQDQPTIDRTDLITPANGFVKSFSATSWRVGTVYNPVKDLALYGQYSTAVDPVGNLITLATTQKDFQLSTGKQAEIGIKQSFWQGRGEWTLAGYQIVKNNLLSRDPNNPTSDPADRPAIVARRRSVDRAGAGLRLAHRRQHRLAARQIR